MQKVRYEVDPHNRLVVSGGVSRFRRVLDGVFSVDAHNALTYHVKSPLPAGQPTPSQVKLSGSWSLDKRHDFVYTLDSWQNQTSGDQLTLRGQIIDAKSDSLTAALVTRSSGGSTNVYMLSLAGSWQTAAANRLKFELNTSSKRRDTLTFDGAWELGKNYELIYHFEKQRLARSKRKTHTISFKGHWDISDKTRLGYVLDGSMVKKPAFTFTGSWKLSDSCGLLFELKQQGKLLKSISLAARAKLSKHNTIICTLRDTFNRSAGTQVELSRETLKGDGQAFLRLLASRREQGVFIGMGRSW